MGASFARMYSPLQVFFDGKENIYGPTLCRLQKDIETKKVRIQII